MYKLKNKQQYNKKILLVQIHLILQCKIFSKDNI